MFKYWQAESLINTQTAACTVCYFCSGYWWRCKGSSTYSAPSSDGLRTDEISWWFPWLGSVLGVPLSDSTLWVRWQERHPAWKRKLCHLSKKYSLLEELKSVSWSLTSLFSTNMAISETKGQRWKVIRTQWRKASNVLTSTLAAFLFFAPSHGGI